MLTVHFNGDVINHPDNAAIYQRRVSEYDQQGRCKYGQKEIHCPAYLKYIDTYLKNYRRRKPGQVPPELPRCHYAGCRPEINFKTSKRSAPVKQLIKIKPLKFYEPSPCPMTAELVKRGNKKKLFRITGAHFRKLAGAGHLLMKRTNNKAVFFTLTFPKFKKPVTDAELNKYFSKFMENARKHYNVNAYVAVREHGEKRGRTHYHVIVDMPFTSYTTLNNSWCNTISDICDFSPNALQTDKGKSLIYDFAGALRYVCKYFAKARGSESESRLIFIGGIPLSKKIDWADPGSGEIKSRRVSTLKKDVDTTWQKMLPEYKNVWIRHDEFITIFTIIDKREFKRFCQDIVYPLFDYPINRPPPLRKA